VRAVGNAATKTMIVPDAQGAELPEGDDDLPGKEGGDGEDVSGGVYDHGT
jgi:hypothetical protein